ncbi:MAG: hypothetical protein ABEJ56_04615 [Candidatus Nanohaloarchaea archaeon]
MKLLKITEGDLGKLDKYFEDSATIGVEEISPRVVDNEIGITLGGKEIADFDAAYAEIPVKNAVFGRVLLEILEELDMNLNYSSTAFFAMAKKNYLYQVLHQKGIDAPKTAVIADEKSVRNMENHLKGPLVATRYNNLEEKEKARIDTVEGIGEFVEGLEYGEGVAVFRELEKGEKYLCLAVGNTVISLKDDTDGWKFERDRMKYSTVSSELEQKVLRTRKVLGSNLCEVKLRGEKIVDVNPNPDLQRFKEISGKDTFGNAAEVLKED